MTITLSEELEAALKERARLLGVTPEAFVEKTLREKVAKPLPFEPRDEWERRLLSIATDCGVSPPDSALTREELYD